MKRTRTIALTICALGLVACGPPETTVDGGLDSSTPTDAGTDATVPDARVGDTGPSPGEVGDPCTEGSQCASGICFPTGFGTSVCTEGCTDDGDCVAGWLCAAFGGAMACQCGASGEACNAVDDDCDGRIDEGEPATIGCAEGQVCTAGTCDCPAERMCDGRCVDIETDPTHCGMCDNACGGANRCLAGACCTPSPETCNGMDDDCDGSTDEGSGADLGCGEQSCTMGSCGCASMCGGRCVDLRSDRDHCGACDSPCSGTLDCIDGACCEASGTRVDVLFMVDNSNSMEEEQESLAAQIPRMVTALATGDIDGDGTPESEPVRDLHLGVITSDMGTGGATVPTCARSDFGDDGILRTEGRTDLPGCMATYPSFLSFVPGTGASAAAAAADFACVAQRGTGGCGFEQQLEAVLKATTPSTAPTRFFRSTTGHADGANAGFLRSDSVLVTLLLTDENDCSALDPDIFNPFSPVYGATDLNLRCFAHASALHPLTRYADGLVATRSDPRDLIFAAITGIPTDLVSTGPADYTRILTDSRMIEQVDIASGGTRLVPSCDVPRRGRAFPPRRIVRTAQAIEARGGTAILGSICQADYSGPMDALLSRVSARLRESCSMP